MTTASRDAPGEPDQAGQQGQPGPADQRAHLDRPARQGQPGQDSGPADQGEPAGSDQPILQDQPAALEQPQEPPGQPDQPSPQHQPAQESQPSQPGPPAWPGPSVQDGQPAQQPHGGQFAAEAQATADVEPAPPGHGDQHGAGGQAAQRDEPGHETGLTARRQGDRPAEPANRAQPADKAQPAEPASTAQPAEPASTAQPAEPANGTQPTLPAKGERTLAEQTGRRRLSGRYRLDDVLGRGATGTVWAAYDEVLRRRVAVKEVPPPPGMPPDEADVLRERTLREARAIAVLSHPNVVTLYDVVQQGGEPFVVMELLPARTLAAVISDNGPLDIGGTALVGSAVASALQSAHQAGITHRDVKPGNVLIGDDGRIKLTDFGISHNVADSRLTVTGMTLGSPAFIAPEVASGGKVTPAADLWGLGATLFAAVQGRPPYDAGDPLATVAAVVHGEVPWPDAAGPLAPVIRGLMVKDPSRRLPLGQVRQLLHPLIPPDGRVLRHDPATVALRAERTAGGPGAGPSRVAAAARVPGTDRPLGVPQQAPLAREPGRLPFGMAAGQRGRSLPARLALAAACLVLFAAGAGGGFAMSRAAAGAPLVPAFNGAERAPAVPSELGEQAQLVTYTLSVDQNDPGGTFTMLVPTGWNAYRADLSPARPGLAVVFVSPDGSRAVSVERLADFYPKRTIDDFRRDLNGELGKAFDAHTVLGFSANGTLRPGAAEPPHELTYRTVAGSDGPAEVGRSTFVQLIPTTRDLWVYRVTVPTEQERAARLEVFEELRPSFTPVGS